MIYGECCNCDRGSAPEQGVRMNKALDGEEYCDDCYLNWGSGFRARWNDEHMYPLHLSSGDLGRCACDDERRPILDGRAAFDFGYRYAEQEIAAVQAKRARP